MIQRNHAVTPHDDFTHIPPQAQWAAFELLSEGILFLDPCFCILAANAAASNFFKISAEQLPGLALDQLLDDAARRQFSTASQLLKNVASSCEQLRLQSPATATGAATTTLLRLHSSPAGEVRWIATLHPASEREPSDTMPAGDRDHDYLTGLPTRAILAARLRQAEQHAHHDGSRYAVLFVDVDRFKQINDVRGHDTGDAVLKALAGRLSSAVRPGDLVARFGGDEFVILIENILTDRQVDRIARRIRAAVNAPIEIGNAWIPVRASVGRAFGDANSRIELVLRQADRSMYRAKRARHHRHPR